MAITNLAPPPRPLTSTESFYLQAFTLLATHLKRGPTLREFARYCSRNIHTVHDALRVLVTAGALAQDIESGRFKLPAPPAAKSRTKPATKRR